ncbi:MAG: 2-oxo-4-hydroxy-4-carboxy-5-ureidoimidazoline decarboxylase [Rhizomicrobium sp.]
MPADRFRSPPSTLSEHEFVRIYGGVYEHSPWFAAEAWRTEPHDALDTLDGLAAALRRAVESADDKAKLALIGVHPSLAGRVKMSAESTSEQASAGLDNCSREELAEFRRLNEDYAARFDFPFIKAVRGFTRQEILTEFRARLNNDPKTEFRTALDEIHKIARLRLGDLT